MNLQETRREEATFNRIVDLIEAGPRVHTGPEPGMCFAVAILKFLMLSEQGAQPSHFALEATNSIGSSGHRFCVCFPQMKSQMLPFEIMSLGVATQHNACCLPQRNTITPRKGG